MKRLLSFILLVPFAIATIAQQVIIEKVRPGELGKLILKQVVDLRNVESLTIKSGTLGYDDFKLLERTMQYMKVLDLGGISNTSFRAAYKEYGNTYHTNFTLGGKPLLKTLILPGNLKELSSLGRIPSVEELDVPASVVRIGRDIFSNYSNYSPGIEGEFPKLLRRLTLHEGLQVIESGAFDDCDSLEQVTLPATLIKATDAFAGCDNLSEVTCLAPVPPFLANVSRQTNWNWNTQKYDKTIQYDNHEGLYHYNRTATEVGGVSLSALMNGHVLICPSTGGYELERGWDHFPIIRDLDNEPAKNLRVAYNYTLIGSNIPKNKPNLTLAHGYFEDETYTFPNMAFAGKMLLQSSETLSLGTYTHETDQDETVLIIPYNGGYNYDHWHNELTRDDAWPSLYCDTPMRADSVRISMRFTRWNNSQSFWAFTSLPFDCKLSDLRVTEGSGVQWAIRKYSGKKRADAKFEEVWVKQTTDSVLHVGEGFIIAVNWNRNKSEAATLVFTAQNNAQKNCIFTTQTTELPLRQYAAMADCDRSWNLVGNPYPCFYSTKYFLPAAPFTVWDRQSQKYLTYSPIDDDYVLAPFESFFIQRPVGYDNLTLPQYGRFKTIMEYDEFMKELNSSARAKARGRTAPAVALNPDRKVHNILLSKDSTRLDRTRLVVNPEASAEYEAGLDAAKFRELDAPARTLLYIIGSDSTHYAISEQPLQDGETVALGAIFTEAGEYTITGDSTLTLFDAETGSVQSLSQSYTFTAEAGTANSRFRIARASGWQTADITLDDVQYQLNGYYGKAQVKAINAQKETVEIPAFINYEGMRYTVNWFSMDALRGSWENNYQSNTAVRHLILPSTITNLDVSINNDDALESITLYALTPPDHEIRIDSYDQEKYNTFKLYVPKAVVNTYKTTEGWWDVPTILPAETEADILVMHKGTVTFDDSSKPANKPQLLLRDDNGNNHGGHVSVEGSETLRLGNFETNVGYSSWTGTEHLRDTTDNYSASLINTAPITTDKLAVTVTGDHGYQNDWLYLCLPFPVRVSDITGTLPFMASVHRYDGQSRANGNELADRYNYGNWKEVAGSDMIPAGEGFILNYYSASPQFGSERFDFELTFPASTVSNDIFATARTITLKDYSSSKTENRGWNFVGNTFPAYYCMAASDLRVPYMLWGDDYMEYKSVPMYSRTHYYTYTRDDDDMLLKPFQPFFVQYSSAQSTIKMPANGRYHNYPQFMESRRNYARHRTSDGNRNLYDIHVTGENQHDRTRIVLNAEASADFESACDAPKMMTAGMAMLYTTEGDLSLSINERPAPTGSITLCLDIATEGEYTLSLGKHTADGIIVTDTETGISTQLDTDSYTFTAKGGTRRFSITFNNSATGVSSVEMPAQQTNTYDLQGRRVTGQLMPGVYVKNGKKVVVK